MSRKKRQKRPQTRISTRLRCSRCRCFAPKDLTSKAAENWNGKWESGRLVLILCPACQTPLENAEAAVNEAGLRAGMFLADPVLCITGTLEDPGTVLYGRDHLQRISAAGQAENVHLVSQLPTETHCAPIPGGVMVYLPGQQPAP
ncbi:hypothetical protein OG571_46755 (plasmid) [Streptomyces sp. NBC_01369]|uniref:hypothetical protein n=1 Tax=unclassified Streptomyces TaxID=2593676 RepID=UPI00225616C2|nr:hypothetical protein [Streptomyces sp. NBC_00892]MCX4902445.1 hypothetical protein [Streptomyces sp. NBC_00892]